MSAPGRYHIEGVMTNAPGGWLLALDRPYEGAEGDSLAVESAQPPIEVKVLAIISSDDGATRDIVIAPVQDLYDPRLLTGRDLVSVSPPT